MMIKWLRAKLIHWAALELQKKWSDLPPGTPLVVKT